VDRCKIALRGGIIGILGGKLLAAGERDAKLA
jgi:hypothetical protein